MGYRVKRKTYDIGSSRGVTLPKPWLDYHGKDKTAELTLIGNAILVVAPEGYEDRAQRIVEELEKGEHHSSAEEPELLLLKYSEIIPLEQRITIVADKDSATAYLNSYDSFYKQMEKLYPDYAISRVDTTTIVIEGEPYYQPGQITLQRKRVVPPVEE